MCAIFNYLPLAVHYSPAKTRNAEGMLPACEVSTHLQVLGALEGSQCSQLNLYIMLCPMVDPHQYRWMSVF